MGNDGDKRLTPGEDQDEEQSKETSVRSKEKDEAEKKEGEDDRAVECLQAVYHVPVRISAVLGQANIRINQLLKLGRGAVIELDRKVGEAIDIYVNDRLVARGEIVVVDDRLGVTMTEIVRKETVD